MKYLIFIAKKTSGYSLIEILLALSIGLTISITLINIFIHNKANYLWQEGQAQIQENLHFIKDVFSNEVRMAGYQGCLNVNNYNPKIIAKNFPVSWKKSNMIKGCQAISANTWGPTLPANLTNKVKSNTDVISILKVSAKNAALNTEQQYSNDDLQLNTNQLNVSPNDTLLITDCDTADIITASDNTTNLNIVHNDSTNISNKLSKSYKKNAFLTKVINNTYYIKDTQRKNQANNPIYSLYKMDIKGEEIELLEGIDNIRIYYGIDLTKNGNVNCYYRANKVESDQLWDQIISIKFKLLLSSTHSVDEPPPTYEFDGQTNNNNDSLLRKAFDIVINLRDLSL